jgi:poly(3-hydroxybutyrate) depolymerase
MFTICSSDSLGAKLLWSRREMVALALIAAALPTRARADAAAVGKTGRLEARPAMRDPSASPLVPGEAKLEFGDRYSLVYVPTTFRADAPTPLMMFLHGTGGKATYVIRGWKDLAEKRGFILLAPEHEPPTWHLKKLPAGNDAVLFDSALAYVFARATIDLHHFVLAGHSDGASTAMSVGLANGDLFSHVMMLSGGSVFGRKGIGRPRLFIAHGDQDDILPFDNAQKIAEGARLRRDIP